MWTFQAMTTAVAIAAPTLTDRAERSLARAIASLFAETERRFSRFRDDSELAQLNRATAPVVVSSELMALLCAARRHAEATDGLFDPTIGAALRAAGYDRSFASAALDRGTPATPAAPARFSELGLDEAACRVTRPPHVQIDLAGFLKGRTVDRAAALAPALAMIDAGGDAVLQGAGPDGDGWLVDVEDPADPARVLLSLRLRDRAVATSAPNRRRWRRGTGTAHHLIDPRTGTPAVSGLAQVTAVAPTAERADVLAKVAFLLGEAEGARLLAAPGLGGVLVSGDGTVRVVGDLEVAHA